VESRAVRSYKLRGRRITEGQQEAWDRLWPIYGIEFAKQKIELAKVFPDSKRIIMEIGFGMGEATAQSLGLRVAPLRFILLAVMALATATAVAQTGLIAFVGLVSPHLVKARVRTRFASSSVLSALMGGVLLCAADILARLLLAPQEMPVGVLTGVLGGGYLLWRLQSPIMRSEQAV
jgi:ABC-type enterobactin transport system permease subunit